MNATSVNIPTVAAKSAAVNPLLNFGARCVPGGTWSHRVNSASRLPRVNVKFVPCWFAPPTTTCVSLVCQKKLERRSMWTVVFEEPTKSGSSNHKKVIEEPVGSSITS